MKKRFLACVLVVVMMLSMAGCTKKTELHLMVNYIDSFEVVEVPGNLDNFSVNGNDIAVSVKEDGEYVFVLNDEAGEEYKIILDYHDGTAAVTAEGDFSVTLGTK